MYLTTVKDAQKRVIYKMIFRELYAKKALSVENARDIAKNAKLKAKF
jgi:adenine C2-methylase RlmN of 23S rRNA A2503 and tRNA A37